MYSGFGRNNSTANNSNNDGQIRIEEFNKIARENEDLRNHISSQEKILNLRMREKESEIRELIDKLDVKNSAFNSLNAENENLKMQLLL